MFLLKNSLLKQGVMMRKLRCFIIVISAILMINGCATKKEFRHLEENILKLNSSYKLASSAAQKNAEDIIELNNSLETTNGKIDGIYECQEKIKIAIGRCGPNAVPISAQLEDLLKIIRTLRIENNELKNNINTVEYDKNLRYSDLKKNIDEIKKGQCNFVPYNYLKETTLADDKILESMSAQNAILINIYYEKNSSELGQKQIKYLNEALNDYDSQYGLKNYFLANVIGFIWFREKEGLGIARAKKVFAELKVLDTATFIIPDETAPSYGGYRGTQAIIIFRRKELPVKTETYQPEIIPPPIPEEPKKAPPPKKSWCGKLFEYETQ